MFPSEANRKMTAKIKIKYYENQLLTGYKGIYENGEMKSVKLTDEEIKKIEEEIENLKKI